MRNFSKLIGIIALAVAIVFSMTACTTDEDDDDGGGGIGKKLELSGQVYTVEFDEVNYKITFHEYKGDLTFSDYNGGTGGITGGKLSYTIETPNYLSTDYFSSDITKSDDNARFSGFKFSINDHPYYSLEKQNISAINIGNTSGTYTDEYEIYVYADRDVTISSKGRESDKDGTYTYITNNFNLALKAGWNAIYIKEVISFTYPAGNHNNISSETKTTSLSLNNPSSLKWVLIEYERD